MSDAYLPGDTRQRIQDLIKDRKITQAELAEKVGLSNSALSRYLQGSTKNLGDGFIIRIARYFDVSTDFLLGETDFPDRKNYDIEELELSAETAKLLYTPASTVLPRWFSAVTAANSSGASTGTTVAANPSSGGAAAA